MGAFQSNTLDYHNHDHNYHLLCLQQVGLSFRIKLKYTFSIRAPIKIPNRNVSSGCCILISTGGQCPWNLSAPLQRIITLTSSDVTSIDEISNSFGSWFQSEHWNGCDTRSVIKDQLRSMFQSHRIRKRVLLIQSCYLNAQFPRRNFDVQLR